ncbi:protein kinase family protein [Goodfellowiella coeruleoviolacea]|uniref:protein kinase family protein n=1 Tax=Goodfellowiella coeruleoviolacea TaxID=334858 RepID=UPI0020A525CD|nr:protein kinase family protein [Goodfellowiella coeruleoviolacea]
MVPGTVVGDGRYRLLAQSGVDQRSGAQLWRARDGQLNRDVAVTLFVGQPDDVAAANRARRTLERAMHAASFTHPGVSRVLDVLSPRNGIKPAEGLLGMVVAEWTQGTDLVDLVSDGPLPPGTASKLLEPLAAAVEGAHHAGLVLGVDHPQRIRVTSDGKLRLAFPGSRPEATARDDVKGLGAILYLLLTGRWALPGGPDVLPAAPTGPDGTVVAPNTLHPAVPHALSSVAVRSLEDTSVGGIRTSAAILQVLDQVADGEAQAAQLQAAAAAGNPADTDDVVWTTKKPVADRQRSRKLALSVLVLALATLGVIVWLSLQIVSFFREEPTKQAGPTIDLSPSTSVSAPAGQPPSGSATSTAPGASVTVAEVAVFNVTGDPDSPGRAGRVIDGDPATTWKTQVYRQQFPALKSGVGLMSSFAQPTTLSSVTITSPSPGTKVEIRVADSADPQLADTTKIGEATLQDGETKITLDPHQPTQHVLVWITALAGGNKSHSSEVGEIAFLGS